MPGAKTFLTPEQQEQIVAAIREAEMLTSGEIRLHIGNYCLGNEIKKAQRIFKSLRMDRTAERNGILIYLAVKSRKLAVIGDSGIHEKLGQDYWTSLVASLIEHIKTGHPAEGLAKSIKLCGEKLGHFFPRKSDDKNELSDTISY